MPADRDGMAQDAALHMRRFITLLEHFTADVECLEEEAPTPGTAALMRVWTTHLRKSLKQATEVAEDLGSA